MSPSGLACARRGVTWMPTWSRVQLKNKRKSLLSQEPEAFGAGVCSRLFFIVRDFIFRGQKL